MELKQLIITCLMLIANSAFAATDAHFYLQMENRSNKPASVSFKPEKGNVYLEPTLADHTPLSAHSNTPKYGVHIEPMDPAATFNVVFTGNQDCTFNIGFYGPANPKVIVSGAGCQGGGYEIIDNGSALLLYISDIRKKV